MPSCPDPLPPVLDGGEFLKALLAAPRPGSENILAFYDSRANAICTDGKLLFIPLDDHLCHRGDGLFESFCFRDWRIFALREHLERMKNGARFLNLAPPCSWERVERLILETARASGAAHGDLRVFLGRGAGSFGVSPAECPVSSLYIVALARELPKPELYRDGLAAFASKVPPKQDYLARIKTTSYLPNVLMSAEAENRNKQIAIGFDRAGNLTESAIANIAIVDQDGVFRYPDLSGILPGTTLLAAIRLAREKMPAREGAIPARELDTAREILLFTSYTLCVPITSYEDRPVGGTGKPGPTARWLKDALLDYMLGHGTPFQ